MFENLTQRLTKTLRNITGQGKITEENIKPTLREVRLALLEADVALPVVMEFIADVKQKALGTEVNASLNPGQEFIKIVFEELKAIMGDQNEELKMNAQPPVVYLMAGLQGAGKTTTVGKLAKFLKETQKKKVMVVSADVYRPAAIEQLKTLASDIGVEFFATTVNDKPVDIAKKAIAAAKLKFIDILLIDTAGRLHVDAEMMDEIKKLHKVANPLETLFVVDAMTGQDAANTAKAFNDALPLTGVILTKVDGDARGGAALSVRKITNCPIKFIGSGEKLDALEPFHPERLASRILDMGDVLTLIEDMEKKLDQDKNAKLKEKIKKTGSFDLEDFREQLVQMKQLGGFMGIASKLPGFNALQDKFGDAINEKIMDKKEAIINSMTMKERRHPEIIKGSRKQRIAKGSGVDISEVTQLLREFDSMQAVMKKLRAPGSIAKLMRSMKGISKGRFF